MELSNAGDIAGEVQGSWSNEWMPKNKEWLRVWNRGHKSESTEALRYDDEFSDAPQLVRCDESQLRFRLFGKSSAKWWRDWMVLRIIPDLRARFPAVGEFVSIQNCD